MTDGLAWCRDMLPLVSRTFALGIQSLPQPFEPWVYEQCWVQVEWSLSSKKVLEANL